MIHTQNSKHVIPPQGAVVTVKSTFPVSIVELDDTEKPISIIATPRNNFRKKIMGCEQIQIVTTQKLTQYEITVEPSVIDLDKTPVETPVELPPQNIADLKAQMMGILERDRRQNHKPTFEEFTDLDMPDELDDIFDGVGTIYEANSEALRQHYNPFRGYHDENIEQTTQGASEEVQTAPNTDVQQTSDKTGQQTTESGETAS